MGFNTVVVMMNDYTSAWPEDMVRAMQNIDNNHHSGHFRGGKVIGTAHADHTQIAAVRRNTGNLLSAIDPVSQNDLDALSEILRGHGYTVRQPGRTRGEGPLSWGYAAGQAKRQAEKAGNGETKNGSTTPDARE